MSFEILSSDRLIHKSLYFHHKRTPPLCLQWRMKVKSVFEAQFILHIKVCDAMWFIIIQHIHEENILLEEEIICFQIHKLNHIFMLNRLLTLDLVMFTFTLKPMHVNFIINIFSGHLRWTQNNNFLVKVSHSMNGIWKHIV